MPWVSWEGGKHSLGKAGTLWCLEMAYLIAQFTPTPLAEGFYQIVPLHSSPSTLQNQPSKTLRGNKKLPMKCECGDGSETPGQAELGGLQAQAPLEPSPDRGRFKSEIQE